MLINSYDKFYNHNYSALYRGIVESNEDPKNLGRCRVRVPDVHGKLDYPVSTLPWAYPLVLSPVSDNRGSVNIPDVGDVVWVLFEGSKKDYPVYFGGTYSSRDISVSPALVDIYLEDGNRISYNRNTKSYLISAGTQSVLLDSSGITLTGDVSIKGNLVVNGSISASGDISTPNTVNASIVNDEAQVTVPVVKSSSSFYNYATPDYSYSSGGVVIDSSTSNSEPVGSLPESSAPVLGKGYKMYQQKITSGYGNITGYVLLVPIEWDEQGSIPMVVFLHGNGEVGSDLNKLANDNHTGLWLPQWLYDNTVYTKAIILAPLNSKGSWEGSSSTLGILVKEIATKYHVDMSRISVTGQSGGGIGTANQLTTYPDLYSCGVIMCGYTATNNKNVPILCFTGSNDGSSLKSIKPSMNTMLANKVNAALYIASGQSHNSICDVYKKYDILGWMIKQQKGHNPSVNPGIYSMNIGDNLSILI